LASPDLILAAVRMAGGLRGAACDREHQSPRHISRRFSQYSGRVRDGDAQSCRFVDIDVAESDREVRNATQLRRSRQHACIDALGEQRHENVRITSRVEKLSALDSGGGIRLHYTYDCA